MFQSTSAAELRSEQPASFDYRDGVFYANIPALGFPLAIPAKTFLRNVRAAQRAANLYHAERERMADRSNVVSLHG